VAIEAGRFENRFDVAQKIDWLGAADRAGRQDTSRQAGGHGTVFYARSDDDAGQFSRPEIQCQLHRSGASQIFEHGDIIGEQKYLRPFH
jgi:hypothetical protein